MSGVAASGVYNRKDLTCDSYYSNKKATLDVVHVNLAYDPIGDEVTESATATNGHRPVVGDIIKKHKNVDPIDVTYKPQIKHNDTNKTDDTVTGNKDTNCCISGIRCIQEALENFYAAHRSLLEKCLVALLILAYAGYFGYAMYHKFGDEGSIRLLAITSFAVFCTAYFLVKTYFGNHIYTGCIEPVILFLKSHWKYLKWIGVIIITGGFAAYIIVEIALKFPSNLVSLSGIFIFLSVPYIFSYNPGRVKWRPVFIGMILQLVLGLLIIRTSFGCQAFSWLGSRVSEFLAHTDAGSKFVFGGKFEEHLFAMKLMPIVIFFSCVISVLYYLGIMQLVIEKLAWVMQVTMGTTAGESVNAAGNIFVAMTEAPLLIRPLLKDMTKSELHAVMTAGLATIAAGGIATLIALGIPGNHLISASVRAAPGALVISKLFCPEVETSKTDVANVRAMGKSTHTNIIEAASSGASAGVKVVASILANLIAFLAMLAFINATLAWLGARVGLEPPQYPTLTFQFILSYLLWPAAFIMGVRWQDCRAVAQLIGVKTFLNEFVAYTDLGMMIRNRKEYENYTSIYNQTGVEYRQNGEIFLGNTNRTLIGGFLEPRSEVISTYALCGFSNIGSIGILLGSLGSMVPERKGVLAKMAVRTMIAGMITNLLTASIAGLLYQGGSSSC